MMKIINFVYGLVKKNPKVKLVLKNILQIIFVAINFNKNKEIAKNIIFKEGYFFGFHDKCPWDTDDIKILSHKAFDNDKSRRVGAEIDIGYFKDDSLSEFVKITTTKAWNWQQGAMLQWDPIGNAIIFNDIIKNGEATLQRYSLDNNIRKDIGRASASISSNGLYSASISFCRFGFGLTGYGYYGLIEEDYKINIPEYNGDLIIQRRSNDKYLDYKRIALNTLINTDFETAMQDSYHFISHPQFNPDSNILCFFHRWKRPAKRVQTKIYFYRIEDETLTVADTGYMASHYCWIDNDKILAYYETKEGDDSYGIIKSDGKEMRLINNIKLSVDGHPYCHHFSGRVVLDTYPDKARRQHLFLVNEMNFNDPIELGEYYAPFRFQESFRVDLHPRLNRGGNKIAVDCSFSGKRSLAIISIDCNKMLRNISGDLKNEY